MQLKMFAIMDHKAGYFGPPFLARGLGDAMRMFADLVNDPGTTPGRYPADFTLVEIGEWDDNTGRLDQPHAFLHHTTGLALLRVDNPNAHALRAEAGDQ